MIKYKKSTIIISIIALTVCIFSVICLTNKQEIVNMDDESNNINSNESISSNKMIDKEIDVIFNNKNLWYKDTEFEKYSYAVTDLDQNGRIEIISSICQGTGIYTYTEIYEVNETIDGLNLCKSDLSEYDSQADITKNSWKVFYDSDNNKYHYIFEDIAKNGAAEYYENKRDFCLSDGKISEKYLVRKNTIYENSVPNITYTDLDDKSISEDEYNNFEDKYFNNYEKMMVNIEWLSNYTEIKYEDLEMSYNKFAIYSIENIK